VTEAVARTEKVSNEKVGPAMLPAAPRRLTMEPEPCDRPDAVSAFGGGIVTSYTASAVG
jgi:hypothetical protein